MLECVACGARRPRRCRGRRHRVHLMLIHENVDRALSAPKSPSEFKWVLIYDWCLLRPDKCCFLKRDARRGRVGGELNQHCSTVNGDELINRPVASAVGCAFLLFHATSQLARVFFSWQPVMMNAQCASCYAHNASQKCHISLGVALAPTTFHRNPSAPYRCSPFASHRSGWNSNSKIECTRIGWSSSIPIFKYAKHPPPNRSRFSENERARSHVCVPDADRTNENGRVGLSHKTQNENCIWRKLTEWMRSQFNDMNLLNR